MNKIEYITTAIQARTEEIERFGLDIATNQHVIDSIGDDAALSDYKAHMERTIAFSQLEKRKAELHKAALETQLTALQTQ
jgi:hypothetical protein